MSDSLRPHGLCSPRNSPGQNTRVGRPSLLQGIFPTRGSNPGLPYCRILYHLNHQGSPRILECIAYPFSRESSQPRNKIGSSALQVDSLSTELSGKPTSEQSYIQTEAINSVRLRSGLDYNNPKSHMFKMNFWRK